MQKRPIILSILLTKATPYQNLFVCVTQLNRTCVKTLKFSLPSPSTRKNSLARLLRSRPLAAVNILKSSQAICALRSTLFYALDSLRPLVVMTNNITMGTLCMPFQSNLVFIHVVDIHVCTCTHTQAGIYTHTCIHIFQYTHTHAKRCIAIMHADWQNEQVCAAHVCSCTRRYIHMHNTDTYTHVCVYVHQDSAQL